MSASAAAAPPTTIEVVCTRLARYWVAECSEGQRTPAPLAPRQASVLVPLVSAAAAMATNHIVGSNGVGGCEDVHVLLCTRSANLSSHAGEVCLPGGKNESGECDRAAALREAREEVGLIPADAAVLAELPPFLSKGHVSVRPVVARIPDHFAPVVNRDEVEECFYCSLEGFLSGGEGYSYRDWEFVEKRYIRVHFFQRGRHEVWGLTAAILIQVAAIAYGRPPEFDLHPPVAGGTDIQSIRSDGITAELISSPTPVVHSSDGAPPVSRM
uniref:Nudix hydrolase domain-containing protein n=1 Tax=Mantoniella antarctica TaxID=81844 RepID=A0A7S0S9C8_9CHLO|mmetsp:Transcript_1494/g.3395  ORF Transcript_1494/g.3395 Transcript_1494/m.3395 type:complete len:270 (+) Transcript_1494:378-1187(+)